MQAINDEEKFLMAKVPLGATFKHYKGKLYKIIQIGRHSEDLSLYVVYRALYQSEKFGDNAVWIRPLKMFLETINLNGQEVPRFELVAIPAHG